MARDDVEKFNEYVSKTYAKFSPPHSILGSEAWHSTHTGTGLVSKTIRADIQKGNFTNELGYYAHFYHCDAMPFRLEKPQRKMYSPGPPRSYVSHTTIWEGLQGSAIDSYKYAKLQGFPEWLVSSASSGVIEQASLASQNNLSQSAAETIKGAKGIAAQLLNAAKFVNALRRGNAKAAAKALGIDGKKSLPKAAADNFLAWKFGWLPLMSDIYNAHDKIQSSFSRKDGFVKVTSERSTTWTPSTYNAQYTYSGSLKATAKVGITYRVADHWIAGLSALGLTNPLWIAWQLMPFSFVVDWFLNVGKILSAYSGAVALTVRDGYITRFQKGTLILSAELPYYSYEQGTPPSWRHRIAGFTRTLVSDFPVPRLYIRFGLDSGQIGTAMALLVQRIA